MKFTMKIFTGIGIAFLTVAASAAQFGIDPYMGFRAVLPSTTPVAISVANASGGVTNGPVDTINWIGDAKLDVFAYTNAAVNTVSLTIQGSTDTTNWTAITNISLATAGSLKITNTAVLSGSTYYFGTNLVVTDNFLYPFAVTTPQAFSAGYSTPYPYENQFTNSSPISLNANGWTEIGLHTSALPRYLQLVYFAGGAGATNVTASSIWTVPTFNPQP